MRGPERIDHVLKVVGETWKKYPDLRLGQLISNAMGGDDYVFFTEDDVLEIAVEEYGQEKNQADGRF